MAAVEGPRTSCHPRRVRARERARRRVARRATHTDGRGGQLDAVRGGREVGRPGRAEADVEPHGQVQLLGQAAGSESVGRRPWY